MEGSEWESRASRDEEAALGRPDDAGRDWVPDEDDLAELYSPEYLEGAASGDARAERLAELRRRVAKGAYQVSADEIARALLRRTLLGD
jgi:anti-sigma28 factor (negative regulator of flagellin synthesis)